MIYIDSCSRPSTGNSHKSVFWLVHLEYSWLLNKLSTDSKSLKKTKNAFPYWVLNSHKIWDPTLQFESFCLICSIAWVFSTILTVSRLNSYCFWPKIFQLWNLIYIIFSKFMNNDFSNDLDTFKIWQ